MALSECVSTALRKGSAVMQFFRRLTGGRKARVERDKREFRSGIKDIMAVAVNKARVERDKRGFRRGIKDIMAVAVDVDITLNSSYDLACTLWMPDGDKIVITVKGAVTQEIIDEVFARGNVPELERFASSE